MTAPAVPAAPAAPAAASTPSLRELTADEVVWVDHLRSVRADQRQTKARDEEVSVYLKTLLEGHSGATYRGKLVLTITPHDGREKVDMRLLRTKYPEVYAEVVGRGDGYKTMSLK